MGGEAEVVVEGMAGEVEEVDGEVVVDVVGGEVVVLVGEDEAGVEEDEEGGLGGRTATAAVIAVLTCRWNPPTPLCPS